MHSKGQNVIVGCFCARSHCLSAQNGLRSSSGRGSKPGSTLSFAATAFPKTNDSRGCCPLSCVPVSILCGDPEFPSVQHAGASPPGSLPLPAYEHFGLHTLHVIFVGERVFAGCRENRVPPSRFAASNPGVLAMSEARFATIVATAGLSLELGKPPHDRTPRIRRRPIRHLSGSRCPASVDHPTGPS
jgi:hypothetical protein